MEKGAGCGHRCVKIIRGGDWRNVMEARGEVVNIHTFGRGEGGLRSRRGDEVVTGSQG